MKRTALALLLITIIVSSIAAWLVHSQNSELQNQIGALKAQNGEVQAQLSELQNQLSELQLQNREQQDRLNDFTNVLAKARHLHVEITDWSKGSGGPIAGLTFIIGIYVTIQNNDVIPVSGLTVSVTLVNKDNGAQIGDTGVLNMGRLNAGERGNFSVPVLHNINSLSLINSAECVIVLKAGSVILDQFDSRN
jgi:ABC-type multidrug transport system fused ATPase/permease subunit